MTSPHRLLLGALAHIPSGRPVIAYDLGAGTGRHTIPIRFTRPATHPAYQAMLEIGRVQRTIFVARYLRDRDLQRGIEEGLNVVEAWNGANAVICYGRGGEISTSRHEEVEMTALCLRILQAAWCTSAPSYSGTSSPRGNGPRCPARPTGAA